MRRYLLLFALSAIASAVFFLSVRTLYSLRQESDPAFETLLNDQTGHPIVMFGDSVIRMKFPKDAEPLGIDEFAARALKQPVFLVRHEAYSPIVYKYLADALIGMANRPKLVILPVNLRSWSPEWGDRPAYQFALTGQYVEFRKRGVIAPELISSWIAGFNQRKLTDEWAARRVLTVDGRMIGTNGELQRRADALLHLRFSFDPSVCATPQENPEACATIGAVFRWHYGSEAENAALLDQSLADTIATLEQAGIGVVPYLTPVDMADAVRFGGREVSEAIAKRSERIRRVVAGQRVAILDLHDLLPPERFGDWTCVCEHMDGIGREQVAARVADAVRAELAKTQSASRGAAGGG